MKPKAAIKIAIDILMTLGLLFLMGYQFWGDGAHEWVGATMFLLFIVHHILNFGWYKSLFKGKYSAARVLQLVINLMLFLAMLLLMVSAVLLSNHVFAFLGLSDGVSFARLAHMAASHWGFVLMALHLGLHWGMFLGMTRKALKLGSPTKGRRILCPLMGGGIAAYGLSVFIRRELLTYMFLQTQFVFLDFNESRILYYLDYLAMMGTFIFIAYYALILLRKHTGKSAIKGGTTA